MVKFDVTSPNSRNHVALLTFSRRFLGLLASGRRVEALRILGQEVIQDRGLVGLAQDSLDHSQEELRQTFCVLAEPSNYPILVHCSQGKDRTGLIVLLLLSLLGVPEEAIEEDYSMSEEELLPEKATRLAELAEMGLTEDFATCPPSLVSEVKKHIKSKYGGTGEYFDRIGIDAAMQKSLRDNLH